MELHEGSSIFRVWPSNEPLRGREGEGIARVSGTVRSRGTFGWRRRTSGRAGRTWARFALSEARRPSVSSSRRVFPREARARPRSPWSSRPRAPPPARYALSCAFQGEKKIQPSPAPLICARGRDGRRPPDRRARSTRVNERATRSDPASDTASRARTCERVKGHAPRRGESPYSRNGAFGGRRGQKPDSTSIARVSGRPPIRSFTATSPGARSDALICTPPRPSTAHRPARRLDARVVVDRTRRVSRRPSSAASTSLSARRPAFLKLVSRPSWRTRRLVRPTAAGPPSGARTAAVWARP